jgi:hypothetical protein
VFEARAAQRGAAVEAAARAVRQGAAVAFEARAARRGAAVAGGPLEPDLVWLLRGGMKRRACPGILAAILRPGRNDVVRKSSGYNADPDGEHANKDTAAENSPSIEAAHDTTPAISEHTRYRV